MSVLEKLTEEECYLYAILTDPSGLDQAEFLWVDAEHVEPTGEVDEEGNLVLDLDGEPIKKNTYCFRAWPYQWAWWRCEDQKQIDACGRALSLDTVIPTPEGWTTMGQIKVGDTIYADDGTPTKVEAVSEIFTDRDCFEVVFSDGTSIVADGEHLWSTRNKTNRKALNVNRRGSSRNSIVTTYEILNTLKVGKENNHSVDIALPLEGNNVKLLVDPYYLGFWLGDGNSRTSEITTADLEVLEILKSRGFDIVNRANPLIYGVKYSYPHNRKTESLQADLRKLGVLFNKHIPNNYLRASIEDRRLLLAGIMDSDGHFQPNGSCEITQKSEILAKGILELVRSLGENPRLKTKRAFCNGKDCGIVYRISWRPRKNPFILNRKFIKYFDSKSPKLNWRAIVDVRKVESVPTKCIRVSNDSHLFLAGESMIPTHNSVGKSLSIKVRGFAFPFLKPGQEMLLTAPEGNHLDAITDLIETQILSTRLSREMLVNSRSKIKHRPFHVNFANGARLMGRIPQRDGRGVKGQHPVWLELDEAQDYPDKGWIEINETLKRGSNGIWRSHGVTRGLRDYFYKYTQPESDWTVHRFCLPGETLVYTINGPKRIDEIVKGDKVWNISESGALNFESVNETFDNGIKKLWKVKTKGGYSLTSTGNHPYLVLSDYGTRKTRRDLRFKWVEAENLKKGDVVVCVRELPNFNEEVHSDLKTSVSNSSIYREVPNWIWRASKETQIAFLYGYLIGDGSLNKQNRDQDAIAIGTGSAKMAKQLKALCHYLGIRATDISSDHNSYLSDNPQYRFYVYLDESWFNQIPNSYSIHDLQLDKHFVARTVDSVVDTGEYARTYDISVGVNHNFIAEGMLVHNTAMHRPTWTEEERQSAIKQYGSRENPDYRRNILGLHGDAQNPLFVLHRLAKCVDYDLSSDYNTNEFTYIRLNNEMVVDNNDQILNLIDLPASHISTYKNFWIGMDVGYTNHPSEILVFAEVPNKGDVGPTLKLVTRVKLERIRNGHQVQVMLYLMDFYKPLAFSMDKTGVGLPLFQDLQDAARKDRVLKVYLDKIKGYNFSSNIVVDFDDTIEYDPDLQDESEIYMRKNVLEYASDRLRALVDERRLALPYTPEGGEDVVGEFQGQTWSYDNSTMTTSGKRKSYSAGKFHALDAAKMAVLGYQQHGIEKALKQDKFRPIEDVFIF